jgi:3-keto-5-aminohexanoate cleavage enzyme
MNAIGVKPVPIIWSVGSIRATKAMADMGLFKPPLWCELVLTAGTRTMLLNAHPGNVAGLGAYSISCPRIPTGIGR